MNRCSAPPRFTNVLAWAALSTILLGSHLSAASFEAASPIKPYYNFICYASVGDVERALAQFADDAVVVTGGSCTVEYPCRGKAAIKERYIAPIIQGRRSLPLPSRYDGRRIHTVDVHHVQDRQVFEFQEGQIVSVHAESVSEDAPTLAAGRDQALDD